MADKVAVLNGEIEVGDRIAVAVGQGRHGGGMRVGEILAIEVKPGRWGDSIRVKLNVEQTGGYPPGPMPYIKTYDDPARMVKLGALEDAL